MCEHIIRSKQVISSHEGSGVIPVAGEYILNKKQLEPDVVVFCFNPVSVSPLAVNVNQINVG